MPPLYNAYEAKILNVLHSKLCKEKLVFLFAQYPLHLKTLLCFFFLSLFFIILRSHLATSFNQNQRMCVTRSTWNPIWRFPLTKATWDHIWRPHLATSFNWNKRMCKKRSHYDGWPTQVKRGKSGLILRVTYPGGRMTSFFGWPTQVKKKDGEWSHSLGDLPRKNGGLIVMGDLPKWKRGRVVSFL